MAFRRTSQETSHSPENIFISITDLTISILLVVMILLAFVGSNLRDTRALSKIANQDEAILRLVTEKSSLTDQLKATKASFHMIQVAMQTAIKEVEKKTIINKNLQIELAQSEENLRLEKIKISTELETAQNSISARAHEIRKQKTKVQLLETRIQILAKILNNQRVEIGEKIAEIDSLNKSILQINLQLDTEKSAKTALNQIISDMQKALREKQIELQLLKVENTKTLKKLDIKTELLKKSSIQVKQSDREIEDFRRLATNLREEKSQKISTLQSQLLAVTDQNHNLEEAQSELQLQYNLSLKEINLLRKNKENLEQQVSKEKQATFALLSNLNKANSEIKAIREKLERVRSDSQKREVVAQQKELENINELRDLEAQKVFLIQEVEQHGNQIVNQKQIILELSHKLGLVENQLQLTLLSQKNSEKTLLTKIKELEKNKSANQRLQNTVDQSRSELTALAGIKAEKLEILRELELIQVRLASQNIIISEQKDKVHVLTEKINRLTVEQKKQELHLSKRMNQVEKLTRSITKIQKKVANKTALLDASIQGLTESNAKLEASKKEEAELISELNLERELSRKAQDKVLELNQKVVNLQYLLSQFEENRQQKIASLQEQLIEISNQNLTIRENLETLRAQYNTALQQIDLRKKIEKNLRLQLSEAKIGNQDALKNLQHARAQVQATLLALKTAQENRNELQRVAQKSERLLTERVQTLEAQNRQIIASNSKQKEEIKSQNQFISKLTEETNTLKTQLKKTELALEKAEKTLEVSVKNLETKNSLVKNLQNSLILRNKAFLELTNSSHGNLVSGEAIEGQGINSTDKNNKNKLTKEVRLLIEKVQSLNDKIKEQKSVIAERNKRFENIRRYLSRAQAQLAEKTSVINATVQTLNYTKKILEERQTELNLTMTARDDLNRELMAERERSKNLADDKQKILQEVDALGIQISRLKADHVKELAKIQERLDETAIENKILENKRGNLKVNYDGAANEIISLRESERSLNMQLADEKTTKQNTQNILLKTQAMLQLTSQELETFKSKHGDLERLLQKKNAEWNERLQALQTKFKATSLDAENANSLLKEARLSMFTDREALTKSKNSFLEFRQEAAKVLGTSTTHAETLLSSLLNFVKKSEEILFKATKLRAELKDANTQLNQLNEAQKALKSQQYRSDLERDLIDGKFKDLVEKLSKETAAKKDALRQLDQANVELQKSLSGSETLRSINIERERLAQKNELDWKAERNKLEAKVKELSAPLVNLNTLLAEVQYSLSQEQEARRNAQQSFLEFRNKIASTISVPTNDPKELLSDLRLIHANQKNSKSQATEIDAKLEVLEAENTLLEQQNSDLRLTVQTLLENTKRIIKQLRSTEP